MQYTMIVQTNPSNSYAMNKTYVLYLHLIRAYKPREKEKHHTSLTILKINLKLWKIKAMILKFCCYQNIANTAYAA